MMPAYNAGGIERVLDRIPHEVHSGITVNYGSTDDTADALAISQVRSFALIKKCSALYEIRSESRTTE